MEKGNFRRERLNELSFERLQRPPERTWGVRSRRLQDRWHRFTAGGWERTFFAIACVVALVIGLIGVIALATRGGGGDNRKPASVQAGPTEARPTGDRSSPTPVRIDVPDIPTNLPTQTDIPEATPADDRTNCDEIRGTAYRSPAERAWYEANCGASVDGPPSQPPGSTVNTPVPPTSPPAATPSGVTAGEAISLAASWLANSGSKAYDVDAGSCSAVHIGDHWIVSCSAHVSGCQSAACERELQACVYADRRVVAASSC